MRMIHTYVYVCVYIKVHVFIEDMFYALFSDVLAAQHKSMLGLIHFSNNWSSKK